MFKLNVNWFNLIFKIHFSQLVTENILPQEFLDGDMNSENGQLVRELVNRLDTVFQDIPNEYIDFLTDLAKSSSVTGLLQVNNLEALD